MTPPDAFFIFKKSWFSGLLGGIRGQKMTPNDRKFCLSHFISQEPYIIWLSFMVNLCKMMISPGVFFIFSKFWFSGLLEGSKGKKQSNMKNNAVCRAPYLRNHTSYYFHVLYSSLFSFFYIIIVHMCKVIIFPSIFFSKFWFFGLLGG